MKIICIFLLYLTVTSCSTHPGRLIPINKIPQRYYKRSNQLVQTLRNSPHLSKDQKALPQYKFRDLIFESNQTGHLFVSLSTIRVLAKLDLKILKNLSNKECAKFYTEEYSTAEVLFSIDKNFTDKDYDDYFQAMKELIVSGIEKKNIIRLKSSKQKADNEFMNILSVKEQNWLKQSYIINSKSSNMPVGSYGCRVNQLVFRKAYLLKEADESYLLRSKIFSYLVI